MPTARRITEHRLRSKAHFITEKRDNAMAGFLDYAQITYLDGKNAVFSRTEGGFAALRAFLPPVGEDDLDENRNTEPVWQELGRVWFHRMFPFETPDEYISVLDRDGKEYGVIRRLSDLDAEQREIVGHELDRKYLCPEITRIYSVKEKLGTSYWQVETENGRMRFSMQDTYKNIIRVSETRIILNDSDGNRYSIKDVSALDRKSYRKIELYL